MAEGAIVEVAGLLRRRNEIDTLRCTYLRHRPLAGLLLQAIDLAPPSPWPRSG